MLYTFTVISTYCLFEVYLDIVLHLPSPALFDVCKLGAHSHAPNLITKLNFPMMTTFSFSFYKGTLFSSKYVASIYSRTSVIAGSIRILIAMFNFCPAKIWHQTFHCTYTYVQTTKNATLLVHFLK